MGANGNLVLVSDDVKLKAPGLDLSVQRMLNSIGPEGGAFGIWFMSSGVDEHLPFTDATRD